MKNLKTALSILAIACMALFTAFNPPKSDKWKYKVRNHLQTDVNVKELNLGKLVGNNLIKANKFFISKEYNTNLISRAGQMKLVITSANNNADTLAKLFIASKITGTYYYQKCRVTIINSTSGFLNNMVRLGTINIYPPDIDTKKIGKQEIKTIEISEQ